MPKLADLCESFDSMENLHNPDGASVAAETVKIV